MKCLITGVSGTGKSTVIEALANKGYNALDIDNVESRVVRLEYRATREPAESPRGYVDWSIYAWNLKDEPFRALIGSKQDVFAGVIADNQADYYSFFDHRICLTVDDETLWQHLTSRTTPEFGQDTRNFERTINKNQKKIAEFAIAGFALVDNTRPVKIVANEILEICYGNQRMA